MSNKTMVLKLRCPKCKCPARAEVKKRVYKFLIYICPHCDSNVVYYNNKTDVLSDKFVESMTKRNILQFSGRAFFPKLKKSFKKSSKKSAGKEITEDVIMDLKILLNEEIDFDTFISKLFI